MFFSAAKKRRCDWVGNSWFSVVKLNHAQAFSWNYLQLWDKRGVRVKCGLCLLSQTHQSVPPELASIIRSGTKAFRERANSRSAQQTLFSFLGFASKQHPLRFVKASLRAVHRHKSIYCTSSSCFHQSPLIHQQVEQDWECINKKYAFIFAVFSLRHPGFISAAVVLHQTTDTECFPEARQYEWREKSVC